MALKLRMSPTAWAKFRFMCTKASTEIGGFGVSSIDDPLLVTEFHLIKQKSTAATVELDDEALANYVEDQVALGRHPNECLRIWMHTHPSDSTTPSGTDWDMFNSKFTNCDWSVMAIMGANGTTSEAHLWITHPDSGMITIGSIETDWTLPLEAADPADWEAELKEKVTEWTIVSPAKTGKIWKKGTGSRFLNGYGYSYGNSPTFDSLEEEEADVEDGLPVDPSNPYENADGIEDYFGADDDLGESDNGFSYTYTKGE